MVRKIFPHHGFLPAKLLSEALSKQKESILTRDLREEKETEQQVKSQAKLRGDVWKELQTKPAL